MSERKTNIRESLETIYVGRFGIVISYFTPWTQWKKEEAK
jgi:hypothetical protein